MRMSCNGCRVLRKGCSDKCSIRPCLVWIKSPDSQANATVFLAKFYGRAGLMNLINAAPDHLRPAIFRSLLYEACGRIVNPIYGSVGLLWSGSWQLCQAAVEAVLKGAPIVQIPSETAASTPVPPLKAYDCKPSSQLHKINKNRPNFKRNGAKRSPPPPPLLENEPVEDHESSGSHVTEPGSSRASVDDSHVSQGEPGEDSEVELELTLGYEPAGRVSRPVRSSTAPEARYRWDDDTSDVDLQLELAS